MERLEAAAVKLAIILALDAVGWLLIAAVAYFLLRLWGFFG